MITSVCTSRRLTLIWQKSLKRRAGTYVFQQIKFTFVFGASSIATSWQYWQEWQNDLRLFLILVSTLLVARCYKLLHQTMRKRQYLRWSLTATSWICLNFGKSSRKFKSNSRALRLQNVLVPRIELWPCYDRKSR